MKVHLIKAFSDNYIWVIEKEHKAIVVDPGVATDVLTHLTEKKLDLEAILLTHHHDDHTGGVEELLEAYPETPVYGPVETPDLVDHIVREGATFDLLGQTFEVFKTAGHTEEHISFLTDNYLFCGDALFSGGCGRVFTKDYQAQFDALQKFNALADDVKVYAAHEYTLTNLRFAHSVRPKDKSLEEAIDEVTELREKDQPTLPSTIGKEKEINLFLKAETLDEFTALRDARDAF